MLNLEKIKSIYFVGIGGIAMSAAASIAKILGYEISGADSREAYDPAKTVLNRAKIQFKLGYDQKNIETANTELFVLSAGEGMENPEVRYIVEKKLPRTSFPELLYEFSKRQLRMVVAGTHGKSTVTGLLGHALKQIDNSSFVAGAVLQNYDSNFSYGDGHYFVFEGDEYKSQFDDPTPKFHYYKPDILALNNLEYDHPDIFSSLDVLIQEFEQLIADLPADGLIIYNGDDANLTKLVHQSNVTSYSFGIENTCDFKASGINFTGAYTGFRVHNGYSKNLILKDEDYKIQLPGKMNVYNALAAIATLRVLGFSYEQIALELLSYKGVKRRFEIVGVKNGITIIDDYAHHPTAVRETLEATRLKYPDARIWSVFEPHTFSRTKATLPELARAFDAADEVLISEIYPARESIKDATITSEDVAQAIRASSPLFSKERGRGSLKNIRLVHNKQEALEIIKNEAKANDVVIIMAVGNFNKLAYELKNIL